MTLPNSGGCLVGVGLPERSVPTMEKESRLRELIYSDILGRRGNEATAREWGAIVAQFEQVCGYKEEYSREDLTLFLAHLRKRELCQNTIYKYLKPLKLLAQVQGWNFPQLTMRRVSDEEVHRPRLGVKEIASMVLMGKHLLNENHLCFLALSTTYGLRREELTTIDFSAGTLTVKTVHGGPTTTHLIPPEIVPYLKAFHPYQPDTMTHIFHDIATKTGVRTTSGFGWHSIRRTLTTELILAEASTLNVARFMRWSEKTIRREFRMVALYAKKDQARIDEEIFQLHPFLGYWGEGDNYREPRQQKTEKLEIVRQALETLTGELGAEEMMSLINMITKAGSGGIDGGIHP